MAGYNFNFHINYIELLATSKVNNNLKLIFYVSVV